MELNEENVINLDKVSMDALNMSLRLQIGRMLNPEQPFIHANGCIRDYRGLAELMGFSLNDILNFQRHNDPTLEILKSWGKGHTVGDFVKILEKMERFDVIDDLMPQIRADSKSYISYQASKVQPLQVSEISSCNFTDFPDDNPDHITVQDISMPLGQFATFDAYVCYADSDIEFVKWLSSTLESSNEGIKLCLRDRDLLPGSMKYETFVRLVTERCNRILIIISPDFLQAPEYEYQIKYAASLASEHRGRRLIPIVYKDCDIPPILKYLSKVDFARTDIQDWIWKKLIASIRASSSKMFVPSTSSPQPSASEVVPSAPPGPPTGQYLLPSLPSVPSTENFIALASASDNHVAVEDYTERVALVAETSPGTARSRGPKIFQKIRNAMGSSSSTSVSSGFHSQSDA